MIFYRIRSISELHSRILRDFRASGKRGMLYSGRRLQNAHDISGTVFDKGDRIGYGGGYYDRYLGAAAKAG